LLLVFQDDPTPGDFPRASSGLTIRQNHTLGFRRFIDSRQKSISLPEQGHFPAMDSVPPGW